MSSDAILILHGWLFLYVACQFQLMAHAINAIDRRGSSNKICCQLQPKQTKIMLYYLLYDDKRCFTRQALLARQLCHVGGKWPK